MPRTALGYHSSSDMRRVLSNFSPRFLTFTLLPSSTVFAFSTAMAFSIQIAVFAPRFDYRPLPFAAAQAIDDHGEQNDQPDHQGLKKGGHARHIEGIRQKPKNQHAEKSLQHRSGTAGQRHTADDHGRKRLKLEPFARQRLRRADPGGHDDRGAPRGKTADGVNGKRDA